jgi:exoribonuclease-2
MEKGTLIELRVNGERRLAVSDRPEGKKDWIVIDRQGQSHKIKPQRIEYVVGENYTVQDIDGFLKEVEPYLDPEGLPVAWELLVEEGEAISPKELAQLLYEDQAPAPTYGAYSLLVEDKIFFKRKKDRYEPRPSSKVEEIQHQLAIEAQKDQEQQDFIDHVQAALGGNNPDWTMGDRQRLEVIEKFVLAPEENHRQAQDILALLDRPFKPEVGRELLVELGWWSEHENLFLRRSSYPSKFPPKVSQLADLLLVSPPDLDEGNRLDLTHLKTYTIDDESTTEIDDGLSIEHLEDGRVRLWIHIADPTRLVQPDDELDLEARKRSTSLYLPTGMIPMFPPVLATGPMSLIQGRVCEALSFGVCVAEDGGVQEFEICPSLVKPTYRLTYDDVDEIIHMDIQAEAEIHDLHHWGQKRQQWRQSQGAIFIYMPESSIKVKGEGEEISIELLDRSPSRQLVAEMMIMAGEVAGKYAQEHQLPVPFRGQPQPELPPEDELLLLPAGPVRSAALRRCMPRSEVTLNPLRHASLGLDTYVQVTSPIRRYSDMLAHFQIKAHLRGEGLPFSSEKMKDIIFSVSSSAYEAVLVERQTNRYWSLEYLRRNSATIWQAQLLRWLREDENLGLILLEDLALELPHRFDKPMNLGDRFEVEVIHADPKEDLVRFRELIISQAND